MSYFILRYKRIIISEFIFQKITKYISIDFELFVYQLIFLGWDFEEGVLRDLIPPAQENHERETQKKGFHST